jgi:hypothetical protein
MAQPNGDIVVVRTHFPPFFTDADISDLVNFHVIEFSGLGMPPVEHLMQSGPQQDGATYLGFRLQPRIVTLSIAALSQTPPAFHQKRAFLLRTFVPSESLMSGAAAGPPLYPAAISYRGPYMELRWTYDRKPSASPQVTETRVLYCVYHSGLQMPSARMVKHNMRDTVQLLAANPLWWDPTPVSVDPGALGTGTISYTYNIDRSTDINGWDTYPIVTVTGPATNITINNDDLGIRVTRSGTLSAGQTNILDLRYGVKTVVDGGGSSALAAWSGDLGTFHLGRGRNAMRIAADGVTSATRVKIDYYRSFIGI